MRPSPHHHNGEDKEMTSKRAADEMAVKRLHDDADEKVKKAAKLAEAGAGQAEMEAAMKAAKLKKREEKRVVDEKSKEEEGSDDSYEIMPWSKVQVDDGILTLWPGTLVREEDMHGPEGLSAFFEKEFDIEVTPVGCVETLPDVDESGENIEGTGSRHDFFFFVKAADVPKFAVKRFRFGMRWWSDVYFNNGEGIYPPEFLKAYPEE